MKPIDDLFTEIAREHLDSLDFHDVAVWGVKDALLAAYQAGQCAASTPPAEAAAGLPIVIVKHPAAVDDIDHGDGKTFSAQVDVAGDEGSSQPVTIDFEPERQRKAATKLLAACRMVVDRWERGDLAEAAQRLQRRHRRSGEGRVPPARHQEGFQG